MPTACLKAGRLGQPLVFVDSSWHSAKHPRGPTRPNLDTSQGTAPFQKHYNLLECVCPARAAYFELETYDCIGVPQVASCLVENGCPSRGTSWPANIA